MPNFPLILASESPRRAALLEQAGFLFMVFFRPVIENDLTGLNPEEHVRILSRRKAEAVLGEVTTGLIVGADTVVFQDRILGKPKDPDEAFKMLSALSGRTHQVYTGVTLIEAGGRTVTGTVSTDVTFRSLSEWEIRSYIRTGAPMDKAGAYGIQEQAGLFVSEIRGCYFNVVGFPLSRFFEMLVQYWGMEKIRSFMRSREMLKSCLKKTNNGNSIIESHPEQPRISHRRI